MKCAWELRVLLVHPSDVQAASASIFSSHLKRLHCSAKLATSYMFVRPNSPSQTAFTLVIALVKEETAGVREGNGLGCWTQVKPAGHCSTSVTIADSSSQ